ncbi:TonB-dependent receptor [Methylobacillus gramineus]|uniref:TonB-dependent receptor n=1 Tax=Methylobacillus gramineus TaxID=755169 RepID=UPI001CFF7E5F|nr:TonB-dependent receptor [Methylobacillus gramineus]MCB5185504.1 TonB-dependent receptor [Methylobacillus gramineus]
MNITALLPLAIAATLFATYALAVETTPAASSDLQSTAIAEVPAIDVTGSRTALRDVLSPGVVSVVYPDDVKGEHKSLPELLDQIPGVYVRRVAGTGQYTTASIRGSAPSQVNVYIDGIPVNTSSETAADLSTISMSNVERVEVYRGVTPARFSGAPMGGAINIVTKKPTGLSGSVSAGRRSYDGKQESASITTPLFGGNLLIGVDDESSEGDFRYKDYTVQSLNQIVHGDGTRPSTANVDAITGEPYPVNRRRLNNSFEKKNALIKWQNQKLVAKWAYLEMERYLPREISSNTSYTDHAQDLAWVQFGERQRKQQRLNQNEFLLGWRDSFANMGAGVNFTYLDKDQRYQNVDAGDSNPGRRWMDYRTKRYGLSGDLTWELGQNASVGQLLELHVDRYRETLYSDISDNPETSDFIPQYRRDGTRVQAQNTITIAALGNLQVTPIVRMEKLDGPVIGRASSPQSGPSGKYDWKPTGSISLKKNLDTGWQVFSSYGNYIRYPSFYEIYGNGFDTVPNAQAGTGETVPLKPETGRNGEFGFGWHGKITDSLGGDFRLTIFERTAKNAITLYSVPIAAKYINSGETYNRGVEVEGKLSFGQRVDIQFASTWQQGWYRDGGLFYYGGASAQSRFPDADKVRVRNMPAVATNVRLNLHFFDGSLMTYIEGKHTGRLYRDVQSWEESLTTFDVGTHYKITKGWKLSAGVSDIFNQGPKQKLGGRGDQKHEYSWDSCDPSDPDYILCQFGLAPGVRFDEVYPIKGNVLYPQQGRTAYFTLAYTF